MMWMILQAEQPEDWVIATGKTTTVREFVRMAFTEVGIELEFTGWESMKKLQFQNVIILISNRNRKRSLVYRPCLF